MDLDAGTGGLELEQVDGSGPRDVLWLGILRQELAETDRALLEVYNIPYSVLVNWMCGC